MNGSSETGPIDAAQLGRLLDELGPALALYASQWTDAADDCVQEALVELARQATMPTNVRSWLYRIVKHRALNAARGSRRRRERETRAASERLIASGPSSDGPSEAVEVLDALQQLEPNEQELIVMKIWGNLNYEEMASIVSKSTSSVHRQYHRALEKLRVLLEPTCVTKTNPLKSSSQTS